LLSIVNNTCSSLVAMEPQKKLILTRSIIMNTIVGKMMTSCTRHVFWNGGVIGLLWTTPWSPKKTQYVKTKG
jgi:hypothetical protein